MRLNFKDGPDFEQALFGDPVEEVLSGSVRSPTGFNEDVKRIIKSISRSKPHERFPRTVFSRGLFFGVKKNLMKLGIKANDLRLFSLRGTDADRYYETDALCYLPPSCGYECVVTIDARLIGLPELCMMREYWIKSSEEPVYSEARFQGDLFAHNRIFDEYLGSGRERNLPPDLRGAWILSSGYKQLWERGYIPAIPDKMIDRPMMRPQNHLILTLYHLQDMQRRKAFARLVAIEFFKQIFPEKAKTGEMCQLCLH